MSSETHQKRTTKVNHSFIQNCSKYERNTTSQKIPKKRYQEKIQVRPKKSSQKRPKKSSQKSPKKSYQAKLAMPTRHTTSEKRLTAQSIRRTSCGGTEHSTERKPLRYLISSLPEQRPIEEQNARAISKRRHNVV